MRERNPGKTLFIKTLLSSGLIFVLSGCAGLLFDREQAARETGALRAEALAEYKKNRPYLEKNLQTDSLEPHALIDATGFLPKKIATALAGSPDMAEARARYRQAQAAAQGANAAFYPKISAGAGASRQSRDLSAGSAGVNGGGNGGNFGSGRKSFGSYTLGLNTEFSRNLFGAEEENFRAAQTRLKGVKADRETAKILLINGLVEAHLRITAAQDRLRIVQNTEKLFSDTLYVAETRYETGTANVTVGDVFSARETVATARAQIVQAQKNLSVAFNQFDFLVAQAPGTSKKQAKFFQPLALGAALPASVPANALDNRPDLRSAELRVIAAQADANVALARLYPDFSLSFSGESAASAIKNLLTPESLIVSLAGRLNAILFDGGALRAGVKIGEEEYQIAKANYQNLLLSALRDTDNSAKDLAFSRRSAEQTETAFTLAVSAEEAARREYIAGVRPFSVLTELQRRRFLAEQAVSDAITEEKLARARFFSAFFLPAVANVKKR